MEGQLTIFELQERIKKIGAMAGDDEAAHSAEDNLRADVLHEIAEGCDNAKDLASLVLSTAQIDFCRWCA